MGRNLFMKRICLPLGTDNISAISLLLTLRHDLVNEVSTKVAYHSEKEGHKSLCFIFHPLSLYYSDSNAADIKVLYNTYGRDTLSPS